jgi:hypothetical protein
VVAQRLGSDMTTFSEDKLLGHINHHSLFEALDQRCKDEDARTIGAALRRMGKEKFNRRLARALADDVR